jgi:hypothetical protein
MREGARELAGAGILSACASMPLHLLPILVLSLSIDGRLDASHAGWVGSAYMIGQLFITVVLPLVAVRQLHWHFACAAVLGMLASAWLSVIAGTTGLLASWFAIGCLGGTLYYLGTLTAAFSSNRRFAFAIRMGVSSSLGATLILGLQVFRPAVDYPSVIALYMILTTIVGAAGLALLGRPERMADGASADQPKRSPPARPASGALIAGLVVLFCLFAGQHGLWAYAVKGANERGLAVAQLLWAMVASKMAGAIVVFASVRGAPAAAGDSMRGAGAAVALGGAIVAFTADAALYWAGLLLWEVGLNVLSARFQTAIAQRDPQRGGKWITAAIFLGAALGPAIAGASHGAGAFAVFAAFAVMTALAPPVWGALTASAPAGEALRKA